MRLRLLRFSGVLRLSLADAVLNLKREEAHAAFEYDQYSLALM